MTDSARTISLRALLLVCATLLLGGSAVQAVSCPGDCSGDATVRVSDLVLGVRILLGRSPVESCSPMDRDGDGSVTVSEIVAAVRSNLEGCPNSGLSPIGHIPDSITVDPAGIVYMLYRESGQIDRWSLIAQRYERPLLTHSTAHQIVYSPNLGKLFVQHSGGSGGLRPRINSIDGTSFETTLAEFTGSPQLLVDAGNHLLSYVTLGASTASVVNMFSGAGDLIASFDTIGVPDSTDWNDQTNRLYATYDLSLLGYIEIDPATGRFVAEALETIDLGVAPPAKVSPDGSLVLMGTGEIYDGNTLDFVTSSPFSFVDAAWGRGTNEIFTLRGFAPTTVELREETVVVASTTISGSPWRIITWDGGLSVITTSRETISIRNVSFELDRDGDGVANEEDAFADDPAASVDSDRDGWPDAWNPGYSADDSTTGLILDFFPNDSACQREEHASVENPEVCDPNHSIPPFTPDAIVVDEDSVIYLLSSDRQRVYRWDAIAARYLDPIVIDPNAVVMDYAPALNRLYLAYRNKRVRWIDLDDPLFAQVPFFTTRGNPVEIAAMDRLLLSYEDTGVVVLSESGNPAPENLDIRGVTQYPAWNPVKHRLYCFRGGSPNGIHFLDIDPTTGNLTAERRSPPEQDDILLFPPVRPSMNGDLVLIGGGQLFDGDSLALLDPLPNRITDATWRGDDVVVTARTAGFVATHVEQWRITRTARRIVATKEHSQQLPGRPLRVLDAGDAFIAVTLDGNRPAFHRLTIEEDSDEDGVPVPDDRFPLDPAASVDSDGDGYPDDWNPGRSQTDSTTGLQIDAFRFDRLCQTPEDGAPEDPAECDIASALPAYTPDEIVQDVSGVLYLHDRLGRRVYRWAATEKKHLEPIEIGSANSIAYDPALHVLYLTYGTEITTIDLETGSGEQKFILSTRSAQEALLAEPFIFVAGDGERLYDKGGNLLAENHRRDIVHDRVWNESTSRVFSMDAATSLEFRGIDLEAGALTDFGRADPELRPHLQTPILSVPESSLLLSGSGAFIDALTLELTETLPVSFTDAVWIAGSLAILRADGTGSVVNLIDQELQIVDAVQFEGSPLRLFEWDGGATVVTLRDGAPHFSRFSLESPSTPAE